MIELKNVTKRFGSKTAVDSISFEVKKGEIIGFLGPNAAGKTTTMRMITGFFPPTQGEVTVAGIDMLKEPLKAKEKIGYMPENAPLYKEMDVRSYLKFIAEVKGVEKGKIDGKAEKAMKETGLMDVSGSIIAKLSKGYRQRVGLAQAILNDPEVLVLDEPTVGLDPKQIREIRELIKNMRGERTIILSTHILPEVAMTCDRVIVINHGKIVAQDEVKNLTDSSSKAVSIYLEVEAPVQKVITELKKIDGVDEVRSESSISEGVNGFTITTDGERDVRRDVVARIMKNDWGLLEFRRLQVSLEDVFLKLVTKEEL
jgi:ABC-2 type transport system ATP-binding protein